MIRSKSFLALPLMLSLLCRVLVADDAGTLKSLSADFEAARVCGDVEAAKQLTLPDAQWIMKQDAGASSILADIAATSERLSKSNRQVPDTLVAERNIDVHGESAVVTELLRINSESPQPPLRRSVFWVREGETWKIAHIHTSPYLRWESSIAEFEAEDQNNPPKPHGIVFVGSSSIRRWDTLTSDFPDAPVIKRGFGGSQMVDSVLYAKRIVTKYSPVAVAVYEGDNDIGNGKDAERILADFQNFVASIHDELPDAKIGFIAIKPSLKRWALWPEITRANQLIQDFAAGQANVDYLDIATPMLGDDGTPRTELFVSDGLHMTGQGYAEWIEVIKPWVAGVKSSGALVGAGR